ncbi:MULTISPECIES: acetate--CoA ligase family protein [Paraburkholderia]|uniref:Acetate--CoA ligase family protein n=1 Tax=Paraburkholderia podalyriae TaxID=1938811 RepID=A0ABR7Q1C9_9BURK|nr:acetate--CoA ligase family protein [Paraburkholderia podalyriae]MBC8752354.1 acetate--CoA ligase family protein [Paraburkholderia podalyriae]
MGTHPVSSLTPLLAPRAIAILGASEDFRKLNGIPLKALLDKGYRGAIYPVNPKYTEIAGLRCYPTVEDIPGEVDLAIVTVAHNRVIENIRALGRKGVRAAVVFSSGFAEVGEEGAMRQRELQQAAREAGVRLLGPNCLGLVNTFDNVMASFAQFALGPTPGGPIALVTQSGALGTATVGVGKARGLHVGYLVTTGNESDVGFVEIMREVIADPRISVGAGFIEGVRDGTGLVALGQQSLDLSKPLVLTKLGRTDAGAKAVASHTGSLAGAENVFDGVARQFGIVRARSDEQLLDYTNAFAYACSDGALPQGPRVGILTRSGGAGALMADHAFEQGLRIPDLSAETAAALKGILPEFGSVANPVDVTAVGMFNPGVICDAFERVLNDPNVDVGIAWMGSTREVDFMVQAFADLRARAKKPFVLAWSGASEAAVQGLAAAQVAVFRGPEPAVAAVAALVRYAGMRRHWDTDRAQRRIAAGQVEVVRAGLSLPTAAGAVDTVIAAGLLAAQGIEIAPLALATNADEAVDAAERLGYPVVLKIESQQILHKTEAQGVVLSLRDAASVREAFEHVVANARRYDAEARIDGVVVQKMIGHSDAVEMVVGLNQDPVFGPVVMVGMGGIFIEVLKDVSLRRAPVTEAEAGRMIEDLRARVVLNGVRGKAPVDRAALCRFIAAVSRFGAAAGPRLGELDLNPVLVTPEGVTALDVLLTLR